MWDYLLGILMLLTMYRGIRIVLMRRKNFNKVPVMQGAESVRYRRGRTGALFVHGFSGSAWDYRSLGKYLAGKDVTFVAPLLEGHGTTPEHLLFVDDAVWKRQLDREYRKLRKRCDRVIVGGDSFGGNLAIYLAARHNVDGLVLMGTPVYFRHHCALFFLYNILKWFFIYKKKWYPRGLSKKVMRERITYDVIPLPTVKYVAKVMRESRKDITRVKCPVLIMQSTSDYGISEESVEYFASHAGSSHKKIVWVKNKYHVFIVDKGKEKAFAEIWNFIQEK